MKKVRKKKIVALGVILLLTCILTSTLVQSKEEITITVKNESDDLVSVDIFEGKGADETLIHSLDLEWGESKVLDTNLSGINDFRIFAYIGEYGTEKIETITTDSDFVVTITKYGTLRITSENDGDSDNDKEEISTSGFEFAFLAIAIVTIIILRRMKQ